MRAQEPAATAGASASNVLATIKSDGGGPHRVGMMYSPTGFKAMNTTLQALLQEAYGVQANQIIGGPDWIKTAPFDLEIGSKNDKSASGGMSIEDDKSPSNLSIEQSLEQSRIRNQQLLRAALEERFKLALHPETRELSTFFLVVGDDGPKLQPAKLASAHSDAVIGPDGEKMSKSFRMRDTGNQTGMEARGIATADLASLLSRQLGTVVVDKTGLTGNYDFTLNWKADGSVGDFNTPATDASASSLSTAVQEQLGLKLELQKGPMQVLVIDHVEKPAQE